MNIPTTLFGDITLVLVAVFIGVLIGAEREYQSKFAGLRTFILVSFGSCVFTLVSVKTGIQNPDRIAANIVTGIGFLGAGLIWHNSNRISGITTATSIWATASLGLCVGIGQIHLALLGTVLVLFTLNALGFVEKLIDKYHKVREYTITVNHRLTHDYCKNIIQKVGMRTLLMSESLNDDLITTTWKVTGKSADHLELVETLRNDAHIKAYRF